MGSCISIHLYELESSVKCGEEITASSLSDLGKDYGSNNVSACLMHSRRSKHSSRFVMLRDGFVSRRSFV